MDNQKNHEIRLKSRPVGLPTADNFEVAETPVPTPAAGQVLVRNSYISVDPYMRGRMVDRKSYVPPFQIGQVLQGGAVGQVVASNGNDKLKVGDFVQSMNGWREWYVSGGQDVQKFDPQVSIQSYLGALGMPGMTAYVGLMRIAALKDGERVFVSAASGAVGSVACQIAKAKGCYVVGSAGSDEKVKYLKELGVDQTINYKTAGDLNAAVTRAFPEGIDVYFENVGGAHLEAALNNMRPNGRIALCGMIDIYNATELMPGPRNLAMAIGLSLTLRGFIVSNHTDMQADFHRDMAKWAKEGKMKWRETVVDGVENSPKAFIGLFKGDNLGKMVVRVGPDKAG
jgi:NADPH-dependent curcumin reductase CurA